MAKATKDELDRLQRALDDATRGGDQNKILAAKKALADAKARS